MTSNNNTSNPNNAINVQSQIMPGMQQYQNNNEFFATQQLTNEQLYFLSQIPPQQLAQLQQQIQMQHLFTQPIQYNINDTNKTAQEGKQVQMTNQKLNSEQHDQQSTVQKCRPQIFLADSYFEEIKQYIGNSILQRFISLKEKLDACINESIAENLQVFFKESTSGLKGNKGIMQLSKTMRGKIEQFDRDLMNCTQLQEIISKQFDNNQSVQGQIQNLLSSNLSVVQQDMGGLQTSLFLLAEKTLNTFDDQKTQGEETVQLQQQQQQIENIKEEFQKCKRSIEKNFGLSKEKQIRSNFKK